MTATKILWGQIIAVFLIVLTTTWGATQWVAWRLGFQSQLGSPLVRGAFGESRSIRPPGLLLRWCSFYVRLCAHGVLGEGAPSRASWRVYIHRCGHHPCLSIRRA